MIAPAANFDLKKLEGLKGLVGIGQNLPSESEIRKVGDDYMRASMTDMSKTIRGFLEKDLKQLASKIGKLGLSAKDFAVLKSLVEEHLPAYRAANEAKDMNEISKAQLNMLDAFDAKNKAGAFEAKDTKVLMQAFLFTTTELAKGDSVEETIGMAANSIGAMMKDFLLGAKADPMAEKLDALIEKHFVPHLDAIEINADPGDMTDVEGSMGAMVKAQAELYEGFQQFAQDEKLVGAERTMAYQSMYRRTLSAAMNASVQKVVQGFPESLAKETAKAHDFFTDRMPVLKKLMPALANHESN